MDDQTSPNRSVPTPDAGGDQKDFVSMIIAGQLFGLPVLAVQDVLGPQQITRTPLAPPLNLRGRIVTALDVRLRLGLSPRPEAERAMSVVVDHRGELFSLMVDSVGEVLSLGAADFERNPPTLDSRWREFSQGVYRLKDTLLVVLDVAQLLRFNRADAA